MKKSQIGHRMALLASSSVIAAAVTATPISLNYHLDRPILKVALAESGSSCFVAGTLVRMADGSEKPIETIAVGDRVMARDGGANRVTAIERPRLAGRRLYSFNGGRPFVTSEHPFLTVAGWRAIDPHATAAETPSLRVGQLREGDRLAVLRPGLAHRNNGTSALAPEPALVFDFVPLDSIGSVDADPETIVYNLLLDGDHAYFANGYLAHNKGDGGGDGGGDHSGGDDGGNSGPGSENSGPGGGEGGELGESGESGESGSSSSKADFGGLEQVGPDLTPEQESDVISQGWK